MGFVSFADLLAPGTIVGFACKIFRVFDKLIKDDKDRKRLFIFLKETPLWRAYAQLIAATSATFDGFFGERLWSWRSFDRCLTLSYLYVYIGFLLGDISNEDNVDVIDTLTAFFALLILGVLVFWIARAIKCSTDRHRLATNGNYTRAALSKYFKYLLLAAGAGAVIEFNETLFQIYTAEDFSSLAILCGVSGAIGLSAVGVWPIAAIGVVAGIITVIILSNTIEAINEVKELIEFISDWGVELSKIPEILYAVFTAPESAELMGEITKPISEFEILEGIYPWEDLHIFIFLFVGIPVINAVLDWASWGTTRWLMRRLKNDAERGAWPAITLHTATDISLAVLFMTAPIVLWAFAIYVPLDVEMHPPLIVIYLLGFVRDSPWIEGFGPTVMLISTLVPTVIHLAAAVCALVVVPPPLRGIPVQLLGYTAPSTLERWIAAGYLTPWVYVALGTVGAALYGIIFGLSYHGNSLWTLPFDLASFILATAN